VEPPKKATVFGTDVRRTPGATKSANQILEWRCCFVGVYEKAGNGGGRYTVEYGVRKGQGTVPHGTEIHSRPRRSTLAGDRKVVRRTTRR
jgi:hypothetical protein